MIFLWAKSMHAKRDWEMPCILSIVCSQHCTICFKRQAVGRSKAALPFVSPSYSIKTEWNVLSDPWHLGESQGILAYCFARTLLTDLCHTFPFILGYASLPRCLWIRCLVTLSCEFLFTPTLEFSCKCNVSIVVCSPLPMSLPVRVPGTYIPIYFLFPGVSMISPSLVDTSEDDEHSWLPPNSAMTGLLFLKLHITVNFPLLTPLCPSL